jgi:Cytochrome c oxidase subunit IIa family
VAQDHLEHPKGTLFLIALYGILFVVGWFAVYFGVYLRRGGLTR